MKKFFKGILIFFLVILICIAAWFTFCAFNKTKTASVIPPEYTVYIRTDSAWDALEPVLDLKAADLILSDKSFSSFRQMFLNFRTSSLRQNLFVKQALKRRVDITVYDDKSYLIVANMGLLSGITRLAPLVTRFVHISDLSYIQSGSDKFYIYKNGNKLFYIKLQKNLVIITENEALFKSATSFDNFEKHSSEQLAAINGSIKEPLRIMADGTKLLSLIASDSQNPYVAGLSKSISMDTMSTISFTLSDTDISLKANFPFSVQEEYAEHPLAAIVTKESTVPELLNRLPENTQYYTFINSISIDKIKDAGFAILPESMNITSKWGTAEKASNLLFGDTIEEVFFSWISDEIAIFGLEGKAEPVIAIKISDEKLRQNKFDSILSSIILKSDSSLLIDSVRLPRLQTPTYIQSILESFGVILPKPYFIVKGDYIYFSQSPENLVIVNNANQNNKRISSSNNWKHVSSKMSPLSTLSLYYNLERSIPFFLKSKTTVSDILSLYNIGRFDVSSNGSVLTIQLNATVSESEYSQTIPGFPKTLESNSKGNLCKSNYDKSKAVFWIEGKNQISTLNTASLEITTKEFKNIDYLIPASEDTYKINKGELWAVSKEGTVYLLTADLEIVSGFPLMTDRISAKPVLSGNQLLFTTSTKYIDFISPEGVETYFASETEDDITTSPSVCDDYYAVYEKGFLGGIHLYKDLAPVWKDEPLMPQGIGFGSPCLFKKARKLYVAFITQNGLLYVVDEKQNSLPQFPLQLEGVFYVTVVEADGYIFALNSEGILYRISLDGSVMEIEIPYLKAKSGMITTCDFDKNGKTDLFISGEGNTIYGFTSFMEMIESFPVSGYNEIIFTDIDGDKKEDCLTLSIDNKLHAYKVIQ